MVIVGMDEVGRGSLAGPVTVGAVILGGKLKGLRDSKLLTRLQREQFDEQIRATALAWAIGQASHEEIDSLGLTGALRLAYRRALAGITVSYESIIIDGNYNFLQGTANVETLVDADNIISAVSAASIIAKVRRDQHMADQARLYPGYGFEAHVGYGTPAHIRALQSLGPCSIHRRSFAPVQTLGIA